MNKSVIKFRFLLKVLDFLYKAISDKFIFLSIFYNFSKGAAANKCPVRVKGDVGGEGPCGERQQSNTSGRLCE